jgi:hypothetical protein
LLDAISGGRFYIPSMSPKPLDTLPAAWEVYGTVLDGMDGSTRLQAAVELSESVRAIRLSGIRARHPELSSREVVARWVVEEHGLDLPMAE